MELRRAYEPPGAYDRVMRTTVIPILLAGAALAGQEERPVADLLAALADPGSQVRRQAVLAVQGRPEPELPDRLLEMAEADPHPNIRADCADVLGTFTDERIYPLLVSMATEEIPRREPSSTVRAPKGPSRQNSGRRQFSLLLNGSTLRAAAG